MLIPRTRHKQPDTLQPFTDQFFPVDKTPQIPISDARRWIDIATATNAKYLVIVFDHSPFDDIREIYPWYADTQWQMQSRCALIEQQWDASVLQVIDLAADINEQLASASFVV